MPLNKLLSTLFPSHLYVSKMETDVVYKAELRADKLSTLNLNNIQDNLKFIASDDILTLAVDIGNGNSSTLDSSNLEVALFIQRLNEEYRHHELGDEISISITIDKTKVADSIAIYDIEAFINWVSALPTMEALSIFNRALNGSEYVKFRVFNLDEPFYTSSIFFIPIDTDIQKVTSNVRLDRLKSIKSISYFSNIEDCNLVPEDFHIIVDNPNYSDFISLFRKYSTLLSIVYIFDITTIKANELDFKLNGYKSINGIVNVKTELKEDIEYFNIYSWTYDGGNINDKIGIVRNLIPLHFLKKGELELNGNAFQSIKSAHKVHEKQNIKQYIEIRNKISDQLIAFNDRANKVIETFASGFQKSALALISFYASTIVLRVLSTGNFTNIFTLDASVLSYGFLLCSFIYFLFSRWEVRQQRTRFKESYFNLKERYTDILEKLDIEKILNNDKEFNSDVDFINKKLSVYSWLWIIILVILFLITTLLFMTYNISQLLNTPIWNFLFSKTSC
jgi:hypothetical protein